MIDTISSLGLFFFAALLEITGGYLIWRWLKNHQGKILGLVGGLILFSYGIIMTFQPEHFGKVYAAYGGVFIVISVFWGWLIDGIIPDQYEIIGTIIAVIGILIIFYIPRKGEKI